MRIQNSIVVRNCFDYIILAIFSLVHSKRDGSKMTHFNDGPRHRFDTGKSATSTMTYNTEDESVDIDDLNEKMQSFPQAILELSANKANLQQFKSVSVRFPITAASCIVRRSFLFPQFHPMDSIDNLFREKSSRIISAPCIQPFSQLKLTIYCSSYSCLVESRTLRRETNSGYGQFESFGQVDGPERRSHISIDREAQEGVKAARAPRPESLCQYLAGKGSRRAHNRVL